jgi:hypothetical protein
MTRIDLRILELVAGCQNGASPTLLALHSLFDDDDVLAELVDRGSLSVRWIRHTTQGPSYLARGKLTIDWPHYFITDAGRGELERYG